MTKLRISWNDWVAWPILPCGDRSSFSYPATKSIPPSRRWYICLTTVPMEVHFFLFDTRYYETVVFDMYTYRRPNLLAIHHPSVCRWGPVFRAGQKIRLSPTQTHALQLFLLFTCAGRPWNTSDGEFAGHEPGFGEPGCWWEPFFVNFQYMYSIFTWCFKATISGKCAARRTSSCWAWNWTVPCLDWRLFPNL